MRQYFVVAARYCLLKAIGGLVTVGDAASGLGAGLDRVGGAAAR